MVSFIPSKQLTNPQTVLPEQLVEALAHETPLAFQNVEPFRRKSALADGSQKFLLRNQEGKPVAVAHWASPYAPHSVREAIARVNSAKQAVGASLAPHILGPVGHGNVQGSSFGVFQYQYPLSENKFFWPVQRAQITPHLLQFLQEVARVTQVPVPTSEIETKFAAPLQHLSLMEEVPGEIRTAAAQALCRLERGLWAPRYVLMHGDFWKGNVLLTQKQPPEPKFVLIDWAGSKVQGYAIFDLIRMAASFKVKPKRLGENVAAHCQILGCDIRDAKSYLLAAGGHFALNLGCFPLERFVCMMQASVKDLDKALAATEVN
ncbi:MULTISPECIES: phosphotransferase [unclassified Leptolyngbya]|uniref:phosphotransferase n=1 Tax=unclassified Leptolyngbya TaxID=2650499 RepID=UPI0016885F4F|nr:MULTISPECIES: phosphotransferase [unclassified Leptolyngbya]MBD1910590.1 phosphotransferase [Leptolyngbya sp. FACHB-8]MBD2154530.1 phosphotransferase [Leptolyngbya sp. FACHB-16]